EPAGPQQQSFGTREHILKLPMPVALAPDGDALTTFDVEGDGRPRFRAGPLDCGFQARKKGVRGDPSPSFRTLFPRGAERTAPGHPLVDDPSAIILIRRLRPSCRP